MNNVYLSKSKYCRAKQCNKMLWLDKNKTSSYEMYQYLVNLEDSMIIKYLKMLTFLSKEEIEELKRSSSEKMHFIR